MIVKGFDGITGSTLPHSVVGTGQFLLTEGINKEHHLAQPQHQSHGFSSWLVYWKAPCLHSPWAGYQPMTDAPHLTPLTELNASRRQYVHTYSAKTLGSKIHTEGYSLMLTRVKDPHLDLKPDEQIVFSASYPGKRYSKAYPNRYLFMAQIKKQCNKVLGVSGLFSLFFLVKACYLLELLPLSSPLL